MKAANKIPNKQMNKEVINTGCTYTPNDKQKDKGNQKESEKIVF